MSSGTDDLIARGIARAAEITESSMPCSVIMRERILCGNEKLPNLLRAPYITALAPHGADETLIEIARRIFQAGTRYRSETLEGQPLRISDGVTGWRIPHYPGEHGYRADDPEPTAILTRRPLPAEQLQAPPRVPPEQRHYPPLGPARPIGHHGQPAALITMATSHTDRTPGWSYTLDVETGFLLRAQFRTGPCYREWTDLTVDGDLNDDMFTWNGPSRQP